MGTKLVRYQIVAFALVTVLGITYAMFQYVGLSRVLGIGQYHVSVDLPSAGGLYANAIVTERGVTVGKVDGLHLSDHGVVADISINDGTQIPVDLKAAITNTSAVGEQYLELTPRQSTGPYLQPGSVIPQSKVSLPPATNDLLANLNALLQSVPQKQLQITVDELYNAFNGSGPQLQQLLDSSSQLVAAAQQNLGPTSKLINESQPVLHTQAADSADIAAFSRNLASFTQQLRASNADLAGSLNQAPGFTTELNDLIGQLQPTVPLLLANLTSVGQVTDVYLPNIRQVLVIGPAAANDLASAIMTDPVPGSSNVDFRFEANNPAPCEQGYNSSMRDPSETGATASPATAPHCTASHSSPQDVRGARNNPCPNNPSVESSTAAGCGLYFGSAADSGSGSGGSGSGGSVGATPYDPTNGLFVGPNDILYSAGAGTITGNGPNTLSQLLQQTLGS